MRFLSTNHKVEPATLKEAVLTGLAKDGGLYMPEKIPVLPPDFIKKLSFFSFNQISFEIANSLFEDDIPVKKLKEMVKKAFNFKISLIKLAPNLFVLELFHGPTLAFKDVAAKFLAQLMSFLAKDLKQDLTVLVATSGDTGSAVAAGFYGVSGIKVIILYPRGKVSKIQEKQLTTFGGNITACEIKGNFDDCQKLVKQAFLDEDLNNNLFLTSANSINIARLLLQVFYYFYAYGQLQNKKLPVVFSVPSGNFGNLTAGLMAKKMGLPVKKFIAATNINNSVPKYLQSGVFNPHPAKKTISNAMDVGSPSNFVRILSLYDHGLENIRKDLWGTSFTDNQTKHAIRQVYQKYQYILDPHSAVGYLGLREFMRQNKQPVNGIFLATAHPAKFLEIVEPSLGKKITTPKRLQKFLGKEKQSVVLSAKFEDFKKYLLNL